MFNKIIEKGNTMENDVKTFERLHKKLTLTGTANIIVGVLSIVFGVACGVMSLICGAKLLGTRSKLLF